MDRDHGLLMADVVALGISVEALWLTYVSIGGNASLADLTRHLDGHPVLDGDELECLQHALTEHQWVLAHGAGGVDSSQQAATAEEGRSAGPT